VKLSNQSKTRGVLDADKHIQKEVGESPRSCPLDLSIPELERSSGTEVALE
jgi:hypothetical protein